MNFPFFNKFRNISSMSLKSGLHNTRSKITYSLLPTDFSPVFKIDKGGWLYNSKIFFKKGGVTKHEVKMSFKKI